VQSLSLCMPSVVFFNTTTRISSDPILKRSVIFVVVVLWWVVVSFFDAPSLAVFESQCEFNQDVSKWSHAFPFAVFLS
jgi:hypothetical protein